MHKIAPSAFHTTDRNRGNIEEDAAAWCRTHQDRTTPTDGAPTSPTTPISRLQSLALNFYFVEALMGWPIEWTACDFSETAASPIKSSSPSSPSPVSLDDLWADEEATVEVVKPPDIDPSWWSS